MGSFLQGLAGGIQQANENRLHKAQMEHLTAQTEHMNAQAKQVKEFHNLLKTMTMPTEGKPVVAEGPRPTVEQPAQELPGPGAPISTGVTPGQGFTPEQLAQPTAMYASMGDQLNALQQQGSPAFTQEGPRPMTAAQTTELPGPGAPVRVGMGPPGPSQLDTALAGYSPEVRSFISAALQSGDPNTTSAIMARFLTPQTPTYKGFDPKQDIYKETPGQAPELFKAGSSKGDKPELTKEALSLVGTFGKEYPDEMKFISHELGHTPSAHELYSFAKPEQISKVMDSLEKPEKIESKYTNIQPDPLDPNSFIGMNKESGRMEAIPSSLHRSSGITPTTTGQALLDGLPKATADQVKALAEGRMQFPAGFALKSPYWQNMISLVSQYDPTFDAVNYQARASTRKDFTSGPAARSLNALNTVMGHLENFSKTMESLHNTDNMALNWLKNVTMSPFSPELKGRLNKFNIDKQAVASEFERAYRGSGGSGADIQAWKQSFSAADSPEAMRASLQEGVQLLGSKIEALGDTYNKGMGTTKEGLDLLAPHAKQAYEKLSGEPPKPTNEAAQYLEEQKAKLRQKMQGTHAP